MGKKLIIGCAKLLHTLTSRVRLINIFGDVHTGGRGGEYNALSPWRLGIDWFAFFIVGSWDAEKDTSALFCSHSIEEIRQIEQQTRLDIERRKEDLRQMVG